MFSFKETGKQVQYIGIAYYCEQAVSHNYFWNKKESARTLDQGPAEKCMEQDRHRPKQHMLQFIFPEKFHTEKLQLINLTQNWGYVKCYFFLMKCKQGLN